MKKDRLIVRQATIDDLDALADLLCELFTIEKDFSINRETQKAGLCMLIDNDNACVLAAEREEKDIGMVTGQLVISTAEGGRSVLLEDLCVTRSARKKGIGTKLMAALAAWGIRKGARRIQLLVDKTNEPALAFYLSHGFAKSSMLGVYRKL